ncbi:MAG: hypothetical protein RBR22_13130 [Desulfuromonas sp.]|nr:hypothetical protein [Desulfuromonas sp.]
MTAKTIAHAEQFAVVVRRDANPAPIAYPEPFAVVVSDDELGAVIVTAGAQGPPGKNGLDGTDVSAETDNQLTTKPDGLYVPPTTWSSKEW